eukprot:4506491-Pleurochrysis_carterae.AAC.4
MARYSCSYVISHSPPFHHATRTLAPSAPPSLPISLAVSAYLLERHVGGKRRVTGWHERGGRGAFRHAREQGEGRSGRRRVWLRNAKSQERLRQVDARDAVCELYVYVVNACGSSDQTAQRHSTARTER